MPAYDSHVAAHTVQVHKSLSSDFCAPQVLARHLHLCQAVLLHGMVRTCSSGRNLCSCTAAAGQKMSETFARLVCTSEATDAVACIDLQPLPDACRMISHHLDVAERYWMIAYSIPSTKGRQCHAGLAGQATPERPLISYIYDSHMLAQTKGVHTRPQ